MVSLVRIKTLRKFIDVLHRKLSSLSSKEDRETHVFRLTEDNFRFQNKLMNASYEKQNCTDETLI